MRILNIVQAYYPFQDAGGPVVKVRALAQALARRGHQIAVLTADLGLSRYVKAGMKAERCPWGWRAREDGIEITYLPTLARHRTLTLNPRVLGFSRASLSQFDVAHFFGLYDALGPAAGYFCRRRGIPYLIEPMGMHRPIDRGFRRKMLWHRSIGRAFFRGAAQIVATSEMERARLVEDGVSREKIVIRLNGVDPGMEGPLPPRGGFRQKWGIPSGEPLVLFLSRLIPRKGADLTIEAFAQACPASGRLVIAGPEGEPGYRACLERRARECGAESRVIFSGALYGAEKLAALADADLFVLPSRYENFANAPAEAMACGVPVIVSDACGIASLLDGQAGLVIPPRTDTLADALRKLLEDAPLRARLKEGCRRVASQLSWESLAGQMESYYADAVARNRKFAEARGALRRA